MSSRILTGVIGQVRGSLFGIAWAIAWPLRLYLRRSSPGRVRGGVEAALVRAVLPLAAETFVTRLPSGGELELRYRERIGLSTLLNGPFEAAEVAALCRLATPGSTAIDVGANVGVFTVPLALSVGDRGRVLSFEPAPQTAARLRANVERNGLGNVDVHVCALGDETRSMRSSNAVSTSSCSRQQARHRSSRSLLVSS